MSRNPADDELDELLLPDPARAWQVWQDRGRRLTARLDLGELTPAQERRLDAIAKEWWAPGTSDARRGELWREQRALTVTHEEPDYLAIIEETGTIAASEAPAASPPQTRPVTPPSAPARL